MVHADPIGVPMTMRANPMINRMPMREIRRTDEPVSEKFRLVALKWADADAAASMLEETKTVLLQELKTRFIGESNDKMSEAQAECLAKTSTEYREHVTNMCKARAVANRRKVQLEYLRMRHSEWQSSEANSRIERKMS